MFSAVQSQYYISNILRFQIGTHCVCESQFRIGKVQGIRDDLVHIVVAVVSEPAAENDILLFLCPVEIAFVEGRIPLVVDRIIGLDARLPLGRKLLGNNGRGRVLKLEMLVLDDAV